MRLRPALKTFGGKFYLADWIVSLFPAGYERMGYVEPFAGGASVLLRKRRSPFELLVDCHGPTANVHYMLAHHPSLVLDGLQPVRCRRDVFERAKRIPFEMFSAESAVAEIVVRRMSRGGLGRDFAWSDRERGGRPGDENSWETFKSQLNDVAIRMAGVGAHWGDAFSYLQSPDFGGNPDLLWYLDPPYLHETRTVTDGAYYSELTADDHERLLSLANGVKGKVMISCYDCPLYRAHVGGPPWVWHSRDMPNHSGQGAVKSRRVEWVVCNYQQGES